MPISKGKEFPKPWIRYGSSSEERLGRTQAVVPDAGPRVTVQRLFRLDA
jgi:hypothetical protein